MYYNVLYFVYMSAHLCAPGRCTKHTKKCQNVNQEVSATSVAVHLGHAQHCSDVIYVRTSPAHH